MVEELPVGYYLGNFNHVLDFVSSQYPDLLTTVEIDFAAGFRALSLDARRLYVRLCSRKGPLFRDDKLAYPEIDTPAAIEGLAAAGYVDFAPDAELPELLALLTKPELLALRPDMGQQSAGRTQLVERLLGVMAPEQVHALTPFCILRPLRLEILQTYKLLFFGNNHQDFTEFVLRDLGISPFEPYVIHPEDRFFDDRGVLEQTLQLYDLDEQARVATEANDVDAMTAVAAAIPGTLSETLQRRAGKIRNRIARQFERLDMPEAALALYRQSSIAPSRERQARILLKQGMMDAALACCREIINAPESEAEYEFAASFARRMLRRNGASCDEFPDLRVDGFCTREVAVVPQASVNVEELARRWFEAQGDTAWYVENGLFPGLFGLAFWDIIFSSRKGAFYNPFQRGPADLFTPTFRDSVGPVIRARFRELEDAGRFRDRVLDTFASRQSFANHFVHWPVLTEALLLTVFERIPVAHVLAVFSRLLRDLRSNRSGFPDLVVFPAAGGYRLAEVKGPGDTLQDNQKRWLRYFRQAQVPAEVVNLVWAEP